MSPTKSFFDLDLQSSVPQNQISPDPICVRSTWHLPTGVVWNASENVSDIDCHSEMSSSPEAWQSDNSPGSWDSTNFLQHPVKSEGSLSISSPLSVSMTQDELATLGIFTAHLVMRTPPEDRFRYRYDTEMCGTHGSLQGARAGREKNRPCVELVGYPYEALIRVSLATCNQTGERYPHPHSLFVKEKLYQKKAYVNWDNKKKTRTGHFSDPHYVRVGASETDHVAKFEGMCIISSKKENFNASIMEKLSCREEEKDRSGRRRSCNSNKEGDLKRKAEEVAKVVNVDFVCLCFEAFREDEGSLVPICPPLYSHAIANAKSAKTGKLKIVRRNKCSGSCKGGDEIWLLVEKINKKGLVIKFFEEVKGRIVWQTCIDGDRLELHHQYAIIFTTPPYKDTNISSEVEVFMRLERTSEPFDLSEPETFVYEPVKNRSPRCDNLYKKESILTPKHFQNKRPRTDYTSSIMTPYGYPNKRRPDNLLDLDMDTHLEEEPAAISQPDIQQLLLENVMDSNELLKLSDNLEEILKSLIAFEDVDMALEKDGVERSNNDKRKELVYKLLAQKLRIRPELADWDVRKLTDQINKLKFLRTEERSKPCKQSEDINDAASTLLSLRDNAFNLKLDPSATDIAKEEKDMEKKYLGKAEEDKLCEILNRSGGWRRLAGLWDCDYIVEHAAETNNPARVIFSCAEQKHGQIELEGIRTLLDAINEKEALVVVDELMAQKYIHSLTS